MEELKNNDRQRPDKKSMSRKAYVALFGQHVVQALQDKPLFPSVLMAMAIEESALTLGQPGGSLWARRYDNHFRIEADDTWTGERVELFTQDTGAHRSKAWYRVYNDPRQSFDDKISMLLGNVRYHTAGVFRASNPNDQLEAFGQAGYPCRRYYHDTMIKLIKKLGLQELDERRRQTNAEDRMLMEHF